MEDLVFKGESNQILTNSLLVAEKFGKDHKNVVRNIRSIIGGILKIEHTQLFVESVYVHPQNGQEYPMFIMNRDGFTLLAMGFTGEKALQFKLEYINAFNKMEKTLKEQSIVLPNFSDPAEAAIAWANEYREKQKAQIEAKEAKENVERLIHNNKTYTTTEISKELGFRSAIELNKTLEKMGIQFKQNGTWLLYAKYAENEYTSTKQIVLDSGRITYDRRWTGKGRDFVISLFAK
ncbi:transcriptional regulator [Bacteroides phage B40-8]|uniref:transcriptional regulator n=1 Tax=Bacteroides phage B40-8 TaxID=99179 RepID=UPI00017FB660|nr:transcriptional regulator [Bacteroides phage B40-8]ACH81962.1 conserved phage protein pRha [Bacteroides phage B40-8]